ncbi:MAG: sarcosine oxidase subunit gamma SoxG [Desulfobacterales bacterium]|jgi:hypothetical protein
MENIIRRSPVTFDAKPAKVETRENWRVVLEYEAEETGPYLIDLSHRTRWDLQDADIAKLNPWGMSIPEVPGQCLFEKGILINRMNRTQASIWHLAGDKPADPEASAFTDVTDVSVFLALCGKEIFAIAEKLTSLDFLDPAKQAPFLLQGPFSHVPCQIVTLDKGPETCGIVMTCSRGYARSMIASILEAGEEFGLRPGGENALTVWLERLSV